MFSFLQPGVSPVDTAGKSAYKKKAKYFHICNFIIYCNYIVFKFFFVAPAAPGTTVSTSIKHCFPLTC